MNIPEMPELLATLTKRYNKDTEEFNALVVDNERLEDALSGKDKLLEELGLKITSQQETLDKQHQAIKILDASELKMRKAMEEYKASTVSLGSKVKQLEHSLAVSQKEAKEWREKAKRNQKANAEKQKQLDRLKKLNSGTVSEQGVKFDRKTGYVTNLDMVGMWCLHQGANGETLHVSPYVMKVSGEFAAQKNQIPVLYTNGNGTYITGIIMDDGEIGWSHSLTFPDGTAERTQKLALKYEARPSKAIGEVAKQWLFKVNIEQKANLKVEDLQKIA